MLASVEGAMPTMAILTMAILTMAILAMALLTMAILTMAIRTMATLTSGTVKGAMEGIPRSIVVLGGSYMPGTVPLSLTCDRKRSS